MIVRALGVSLLLAASQAAQPSVDLCAENPQSGRERICEVREEILTGQTALDVDPGRNGGVHVRGWSRQDVRLRTRVEAYADAVSRARELVSGVRVTTLAGRLRTDGPTALDNAHWATSFYLDVPAKTQLAINTNNGGISLEEFNGAAVVRATNGSIRLRAVAGDIKGHTQNGGVHVELTGPRWEGQGLDVETRNGSVRVTLPADYSADFETSTVHGRVQIDFPATIYSGRERRFTATLGSGGPKIRAVTTNGSVIVRRQ